MNTAEALRAIAALIERAEVRQQHEPLTPKVEPDTLAARFDLELPSEGLGDEAWIHLLDDVVQASPPSTGDAWFNLLFGSRVPVAIASEALSAWLNNTMHTYKAAGLHILIEQALVRRLNQWVGWTDGDGLMVPGGSLSILTGMILGRNRACPGVEDRGMAGQRLTVYRSSEAHYSVDRGAAMLGIGRNNVRVVPTDSEGRMDVDILDAMLNADRRAGATPVMVQATAGTTVRGAFDDLVAIADRCHKHGVWMHVDAAYGGAALISQRHRHLLSGAHLADSLTWDCHKLMGVPVVASFILTRHPGLLKQAFAAAAPYLLQGDGDTWNPSVRSMQTGRRNDALKVWATLRYLGLHETEQRIDRLFDQAAHARQIVQDDPQLRLLWEPSFINVCFYVRGKSSARVCTELERRGLALCSYGAVGDAHPIRLVLVNPDMDNAAIDQFFASVREVAATLPDEPEDDVPDP